MVSPSSLSICLARLGQCMRNWNTFYPNAMKSATKLTRNRGIKKNCNRRLQFCPPGQHRVTPGWSWTRSWELSSGGFLMTNNNHSPPPSQSVCVCVCPAWQTAQARPLLSAPFSRKWIKWSVSKIYVAGDAANNHKKRTAAIFDNFSWGWGALATPIPSPCNKCLSVAKSVASINNSSLLFKRSRGACNRVSACLPLTPPPSCTPLFPAATQIISGGLLHSYLLNQTELQLPIASGLRLQLQIVSKINNYGKFAAQTK